MKSVVTYTVEFCCFSFKHCTFYKERSNFENLFVLAFKFPSNCAERFYGKLVVLKIMTELKNKICNFCFQADQ